MARPRITLKLATSLDGKIALANGESEWITGEAAREAGRKLRGRHNAIAVGSNTARLDNPQLTTRMAGYSDPARIVFDSGALLSPKSNLAQSANEVPVLLFCAKGAENYASEIKALGVSVLPIASGSSGLDIAQAMEILHRQNIKTLLVEGGGKLAAGFVKAGFVDDIYWFRAPVILGGDGRSGIADLGFETLIDVKPYIRQSVTEIGVDILEIYTKAPT